MSLPLLSVLLPCRNAEELLDECIDSLQSQTLGAYEVLAIDDGSTDGTRERLEGWVRNDRRVRLLDRRGLGITSALQQAAGEARTALLARMDADDIAHPERFERQWRFLRRRADVAACGTGVRYVPRASVGTGYRRYEEWINALRQPEDLERDLFVECPIAHPTLVVRAAAFRAVGGYRERGWPEDYDLVLRLHRAGYRLANLSTVLLSWRITAGRLSMRSERYAPAAFRRCKVHHLLRAYLPAGRPIVIWGAGRVGKPLAVELLRHRVQPVAFVDLDPRKIGQVIHGAEVLPPDRLAGGAGERPFVLAAVGSPGARGEIRDSLGALGFKERADFLVFA